MNKTTIQKLRFWLVENMVDLVSMFVSILAAFAVENWREEIKDAEDEKLYLLSLHEELVNDYAQMESRLMEHERKMQAANTVMALCERGFLKNKDSIYLLIHKEIEYISVYAPSNNIYESLKSSGDLRLIENFNLKIALSDMEGQFILTQKEAEQVTGYMNSDQWRGFMLDYLDEDNKTISDETVRRFRKRLRELIVRMEIYYYSATASLQKIDNALENLSAYMTEKGLDKEKKQEATEVPIDSSLGSFDDELTLPGDGTTVPDTTSNSTTPVEQKNTTTPTTPTTKPAPPPANVPFDDELELPE